MFNSRSKHFLTLLILMAIISVLLSIPIVTGQEKPPSEKQEAEKEKPEFPPLKDVIKDYEKVVSTAEGEQSLYTVWTREKDGQVLAALPSGYENKKFFIALTIASGEEFAGLQAGDMYVYWKRYDKRLALIEPNIQIKSTGDDESKSSIQRLFTDRVILDVPIVSMSGGSPVIDIDELLIGQADKFFGGSVRISNKNLIKIKKAKAFPKNIELAFEIPTANGRLQTLHYSISEIPGNTGYKTRKADERVGYFTTGFDDYGQFKDPETRVRYINRWQLEKADKSLNVSPPKKPIVFYIEHTTPVRYRRYVREGLLYWNEAFEKVGISNAIEVYYQDKESGAHMEKDPEDVRYNFIRWLSNNVGTAIGPSRVHPETGQILDADIILTDGWIRHFWINYNEVMPEIAMEGVSPETLAWLNDHPNWDPRIRLSPPAQRESIRQEIAKYKSMPYGGHPMAQVNPELIGDDEFDGLIGRTSQVNGLCSLSQGMAFDVALFRMQLAMMANEDDEKDDEKKKDDEEKKEEKDKEEKEDTEKEPTIDGMPESFIGPLLAELVCHEVGHTLGLRHNFKGSSTYSMAEINSEELKGHKPNSSSVMDYLPINMNLDDGEVQGDYTMIGVGPYDIWAIEYGYTQDEKELKSILERVAEPELQYGTDEDTYGPDPFARRYDLSKNPLDYANNQIRIAKHNRERIIEKLVKEGDSWSKVRRAYEMTLSLQMRAVSTMGNWLGGAYIYRDKKGDKNARLPIEVVSAKKQRDALEFVIENTFKDEAFGLTEDLLLRMTVDKWLDNLAVAIDDSTWPIHDQIMGIQATILSNLMYPTTLRRIYDNEFLVPADEDALTLNELLDTVTDAIWSELDQSSTRGATTETGKKYTVRQPFISSLRRNLQREYLELMIDLTRSDYMGTSAYKPIANLVTDKLKTIKEDIDNVIDNSGDNLDPYTRAHLRDASMQIEKALEAQYIYKVLN
ncbi:MAG: zinc-dependent metalloprotease [Sedimentisphaerales bacterium]|nr:zinc-dependent metalloprotease [Sedimentisphaerales bacterium]